MILENEYSWEEIGELFADRIEKTEFISKDRWKRHEFLEWFKIREKIGVRFDWRLVARAYTIWQNMQNEHDHFTVVVGKEGFGKSTLAIQFSAWIAPNTDIDDILFNMPNYVKKLQDISKDFKKNKKEKNDKSLLIDEGGISLFSREALSRSNKVLAKTFMVQRFLTVHVGICIPYYWILDKLIRKHRIDTLIILKSRGKYKAVVGKGIKIINKLGAKDEDKPLIALPIPYGLFWEGHFSKKFPKTISKIKYENHKFKHIRQFLDDAKLEADTVKMIKVSQLERDFGIKRDTIIAEIHNGKIEGRKIGNQWFITKKAYEKLVMMS